MADMEKKATPGFGDRIRAAREAADLSREGLAYKAGISLRTLERIEAEQAVPHRATRSAIAGALGVEPDTFEPLAEQAA